MNPYDAILEQLRKAQQRGVETVSNRLDFVLESLEAVVNEAKEAIKEAVPEEPDELFPLAECSRAVDEARRSLESAEARVEELEAKVRELEARAAEAPKGGVLSLEVLRRLDAARSQSELLKELLPSLLDHVGRAAVMVIREGTVSAWSGIGFQNGDRLRDWSARAVQSPVLERFVHENSVVRFSPAGDELFESWLEGEAVPAEAVIIPVVLRGRTVGGIYADRLEGAPWDVEAAQVMVATACWLIDTLSLRTTVPSPNLQEPVDLAQEVPAGEAGQEAATEVEKGITAPGDEVTPEAGYPPVVETEELRREDRGAVAEVEAGEEAGAGAEVEAAMEEAAEEAPAEPVAEEPAVEPETPGDETAGMGMPTAPVETRAEEPGGTESMEEAAATVQVEREGEWGGHGAEEEAQVEETPEPPPVEPVIPPPVEPVAPPVEPVAPPSVEPVAPVAEEAATPPPVSPVVPPPPVSPVVPPPPEAEPAAEEAAEARAPEAAAQHQEAQRFARLLVSEIKLYNPEEVERGRANNDIYQRLKDDIDRSREMYEKRIAEEIRAEHDYFREALIRILGDGDEDALGM